ncbi:MAG: hypothetical protein ACXWK9_13385, partial [Myxococcaceae bacterium]
MSEPTPREFPPAQRPPSVVVPPTEKPPPSTGVEPRRGATPQRWVSFTVLFLIEMWERFGYYGMT